MTDTQARQMVLLALGRQFQRVSTLAARTGLSERRAARMVERLVALRLVERGEMTAPKKGRSEATFRATRAGRSLQGAFVPVTVPGGTPAEGS